MTATGVGSGAASDSTGASPAAAQKPQTLSAFLEGVCGAPLPGLATEQMGHGPAGPAAATCMTTDWTEANDSNATATSAATGAGQNPRRRAVIPQDVALRACRIVSTASAAGS